MSTKFNFVQILDPFEPAAATREERHFKPGQSLAELFPEVAGQVELSYTVNGLLIERENMAVTYLQPGDWVTQCPVPRGSGAKNVLRMVAMIALVAVAPQLGALMGPGMFGAGVLGLSAAAWTGIIMVGGSLLINAMLPPPKPPSVGNAASESPTYGIDGAKNTSAEGIPVPVIYGQHRMGGNVLSNYVVNDGDTQYLYMLLCAGEGPIASIAEDSILINDQPLSAYKDKEVLILNGTADQQPPKWFAGTVTPKSVNKEILDNWSVPVTTNGTVDRVRIDVVAPGGICEVNKKGGLDRLQINLAFEYRKVGTTEWMNLVGELDVLDYTNVAQYDEVKVLDDSGNTVGSIPYTPTGQEQVKDGLIYPDANYDQVVGRYVRAPSYNTAGMFIAGAQRTALRRSFLSPALPEGEYEVRYRRTTPKDTKTDSTRSETVYFSDLVGIVNEKVGYRNTACVALKVRLSDQLNGLPTVTFVHGGKLVQVWNESNKTWEFKSSSNPAWIVMDILTNTRYGGGAARSRLDMELFKDWAAWCDSNKLQFHGVFDTASNVWDAANQVARCGRAQLIQVGTRYSVVIERPAAPVMLFSVANIVKGSFKETWLPMSDRANEIEVTYQDRDDGYAQHTIRVIDQAAATSGRPPRKTTLPLMGIVDAERATAEATLALNLNRYILRTVEFSAPIEAVACSVGDVIAVQHDMPAWGVGGRLESGSTSSTLQLDREVTLEGGKSYQAMVTMDAVMRASGAISAIYGDTLVLTNFNGLTAVRRLRVGAIDVEVLSVEQVGGQFGVRVADMTGISPGQTYQLWDTNVLITRSVVNPAGAGSFLVTKSITLTASLGVTPPTFAKWAFGESQKVTKPFRVKKISGGNEYRRDITAIEYNESVYDPSGVVTAPNYSTLPDRLVKPVIIEGVSEEQILIGTVYQSLVTISWRGDQATYQEAEVFLSRNDGAFLSQGRDKSGMTVSAYEGEKLTFRIVAIDRGGKNQPVSTAATYTYLATGRTQQPDYVGGLKWKAGEAGLVISWNRPVEEDWQYTELRIGPTWDDLSTVSVFKERLTSATLPWRTVPGPFNVIARHTMQNVTTITDAFLTIDVLKPLQPALSAVVSSMGAVTFKWQDCTSTQTLKRHTIRIGTPGQSWEALSDAAVIGGNSQSHTIAFSQAGKYVLWVRAEDMGGLVSDPAAIEVTVTSVSVNSLILSASSQIIRTDADGQNPSPETITFTAALGGGAASKPVGWSTNPPTPLTGLPGGATRTLSFADMSEVDSVTVTAQVSVDGTIYSDTMTVVKLRDGKDGSGAVVGYLTNESAAVPADSQGNVTPSDWEAMGGTFEVWAGTINKTTSGQVAYSVVTAAGVTISINANGVYSVTGMSANLGYATLRAVYGGVVITKRYTITKSLAGQKGEAGQGLPGQNGTRTARVSIYAWAPDMSSLPGLLGTGTYTWENGSLAGVPSGWSASSGTAPSAGMTLYEAYVLLSNQQTTPTDNLNWTSASIQAIGASGTKGDPGAPGTPGKDGAPGAPGPSGASTRIAYAKVTGATIGSGTVTTDGSANFPPPNSWGRGETWGGTVPTFGADESVMQTIGTYDPQTDKTVWGSPYLSTWKVGSLSAITANLGAITAGSIDIGGGRFQVSSAGYLVARGVQILDDSGNVVLSTAGGGSKVPSNWINPAATWLNSNITLSANGALTGAGGGQVTIGGLGYSGDLNAQANSRISVNGSGQISGIGTGDGTSVANSLLTSAINAAALSANWSYISGVPSSVTSNRPIRIYRQQNSPGNPGDLIVGDRWTQIDYNGVNSAEWSWNGSQWVAGARPPVHVFLKYSGSNTSDGWAELGGDNAVYNAFAARNLVPLRIGDMVTYSNNAGTSSNTRVLVDWTNGWTTFSTFISGNMLVQGAVQAQHLSVSTLSAVSANIGVLQTQSYGARVRIADNLIQVFNSSSSERVRISS